MLAATDSTTLRELASQLRVDSILTSTAAGSGHPSSSMSAADLMAVLLSRHLRYDWQHPDDPCNDHLIFSNGHASPLLYAMFAGATSKDELLTGFRRSGSRLQGHPTPILPWVDVATGSLGQGLPYGVGIALADRRLDHLPYQVWVLCGDGELVEGSIWEALDKAALHELGNLTAIVNINRLGQRGPTEFGWDLEAYAARIRAFGCRAVTIDAGRRPAPATGHAAGRRRTARLWQPCRGDGRRRHHRPTHRRRHPATARRTVTLLPKGDLPWPMPSAQATAPEIAKRRKELAPHSHDAFEAFSRAVFADGALP